MSEKSNDVKHCRSCGAPIIWALTKHDRRIPLDPIPVPDGNINISVDENGQTRSEIVNAPLFSSAPLYVSHFVTCPNAAQHRRRK